MSNMKTVKAISSFGDEVEVGYTIEESNDSFIRGVAYYDNAKVGWMKELDKDGYAKSLVFDLFTMNEQEFSYTKEMINEAIRAGICRI